MRALFLSLVHFGALCVHLAAFPVAEADDTLSSDISPAKHVQVQLPHTLNR